ncbi:MAG TPA: YitT family protein [Ideonella sp.]|nr:YitT family protein [Ideonella sp.]
MPDTRPSPPITSRRFAPVEHSLLDDAHALIAGALFVALGLTMYGHAGLLTGGVAGLAFLLSYSTGFNLGGLFFVLNLPFYWLAWRRLGWEFTLKTFAAVAMVSTFTALAPRVVSFDKLDPWVAALLGGILIGFGLLALLRHRASVGGVNIVAQYLQEKRGWSAGKVQMAVDCCVVLAAFWVVEPQRVLQSMLGAVAMSAILVLNHRPGRYLGV